MKDTTNEHTASDSSKKQWSKPELKELLGISDTATDPTGPPGDGSTSIAPS